MGGRPTCAYPFTIGRLLTKTTTDRSRMVKNPASLIATGCSPSRARVQVDAPSSIASRFIILRAVELAPVRRLEATSPSPRLTSVMFRRS